MAQRKSSGEGERRRAAAENLRGCAGDGQGDFGCACTGTVVTTRRAGKAAGMMRGDGTGRGGSGRDRTGIAGNEERGCDAEKRGGVAS